MLPVNSKKNNDTQTLQIFSYVAAAAMLFVVLHFGLIIALLSLSVAYVFVEWLAKLKLILKLGQHANVFCAVLVGALPIILIFGVAVGLGSAVHALKVDFHGLTEKVAQVLNEWRLTLPAFLVAQLPNDSDTQDLLVNALKERVGAIAAIGKEWLVGAIQIVVGTIIGVLIYMDKESNSTDSVGARRMLCSRAHLFLETFRNIITAQFFIALINTALTAIFLLVLLPWLGLGLPFTPALLAMTFIGGLLPIVGNLICNTVLTLVALSVGPAVAVGSLAFLIVAHKAEYIVNSVTVGRKMTISAWELLVAIVLGEAIFGVSGLVAAPLYYAYLKQELKLTRFS